MAVCFYCQCGQGFSLPQGNQRNFPGFSLSYEGPPCVASSATTWVNLPSIGGQPTRMYQVRQWACNRHSADGRTSALQYRLESSTLFLSSLSGTTGLQWKGRSLFQFLLVSSVSHMNYGSGVMTFGMWDIYEWYLTSSRSSTERYVGHLQWYLLHHRAVLRGTSNPGCGSIRLGPLLHGMDYGLGFIWNIYERYLQLHCGAVLRGMGTFLKA